VGIFRGIDGSEPLRPERTERPSDLRPERRVAHVWELGEGTIACPACDAPVMLPRRPMAPADALGCPVCAHAASVRDFLSMAEPTRPTRVQVRAVIHPPVAV
jgi:hypothetical protein